MFPTFLKYGKKFKSPVDDVGALDLTSSGAGMPLLTQRTISRQIEVLREIGQGRYGTVSISPIHLSFFFAKIQISVFTKLSELLC